MLYYRHICFFKDILVNKIDFITSNVWFAWRAIGAVAQDNGIYNLIFSILI